MKFQLNKNLLGLILMIFFICLILLIIIRYKNFKDFKEDYINEQFINITEDFKNKKKSSSKKTSPKKSTSKSTTTTKSSKTSTTSTTTKPSTTTTTTTQSPRVSPVENYNESCDIKMDEWNKSPEEIEKQKQGLTKMQECQIKNLINNTVRTNVMETLSAQNPLMTGPSGPAGPPGPAGTTLLASGKLVNQLGSFAKKDSLYRNPLYVATRTNGTNPMSSLIYMDEVVPFVSYQSWQYNQKNQIVNRYDGTCLTYSPNQDKLYMSECDDNNTKQKWFWDKSNRLVLLDKGASKNKKTLKCMSISEPEVNSLVSSVPDCKGNSCKMIGQKRYLIAKDCDVNKIDSSTIFSFD